MKNLLLLTCVLLGISILNTNADTKPKEKIPSLPKPISILGNLRFVNSNQTMQIYKCIAPFNRECARIYKKFDVEDCGANFPEISLIPFIPDPNKQYIGVMDSSGVWNYFEQNNILVVCPNSGENNTDIEIIIDIPINLQ